MTILGIETSCDETSASVVEKQENPQRVKLLSSVVATSLSLHSKTGGIIPETAAREQLRYIIPVIEKALKKAKISERNIDAIAITIGPGLIGSLLVGVETAKTLSYVWKKPIIPVNHLLGHVYANFISTEMFPNLSLRAKRGNPINNEIASSHTLVKQANSFTSLVRSPRNDKITFPAIALIVSGGHTDLVLMRNHGRIKWIGGTRDDAAGEAFDKIGRLLKLPYPGGPYIEKAAINGNSKAFNFPRPMIYSKDFDFSFSGLKTAVFRETQTIKQFNNLTIGNLAASVQQAIIDVLVAKTLKAAKKYKAKSILLGGGVAANETLRRQFMLNIKYLMPNTEFFFPKKSLCTDNAAMIATAAAFNYNPMPWRKIEANPELYFE